MDEPAMTFRYASGSRVVLSLKAPPDWGQIEFFPTSARYLRLARMGAWLVNLAKLHVPWNFAGEPESTQYGVLRLIIHDPPGDPGGSNDYTTRLFALLVVGFAIAAGVLIALAVVLAR